MKGFLIIYCRFRDKAMIDLIVVLLLFFITGTLSIFQDFKFYVPYPKLLISSYISIRPVSGEDYNDVDIKETSQY